MCTIVLMFPVLLAHAESFQLDFDSIQTGVAPMTGGTLVLEGGLTPIQTYGVATDFQEHPLAVIAHCGNGIKENGESCDGTDFGGTTCASYGYNNGSLSCSASCVISTANCSDPAEGQTVGSSGQGSGGRRGTRSDVENNKETEDSDTIPADDDSSEEETFPEPSAYPEDAPPSIPAKATPGTSPISPSRGRGVIVSPPPEHPAAPEPAPGAPQMPDKAPSTRIRRLLTFDLEPASVTLGGVSVAQAGILVRLGWIAHIQHVYAHVPAFASAGAPFNGLLSGMRSGFLNIGFFWRRRKRRGETQA